MANKKSNKIVNYFKEVKGEMKKVVWPSFKQVKNNTLIVIACVLFVGIFIWVADLVFDVSLGRIIKSTQQETETAETTDDSQTQGEQMSEEETLQLMQSYYSQIGIDYDGTTFKDSQTGEELSEEEVEARIEASSSEQDTSGESAPAEGESTEGEADQE